MMGFSIYLFFVLLIPLLIVLGIVGASKKKIYPLMFVLAIFTYVNTVSYIIDAYKLSKNGILFTLVISALIMVGVGATMRLWAKKPSPPASPEIVKK